MVKHPARCRLRAAQYFCVVREPAVAAVTVECAYCWAELLITIAPNA
ncbi:MAG: hypothetical protein RMK00_05405 [Bacteroidota bacterium]|nr:hypothetical protein [Bacteroidota bacterium]